MCARLQWGELIWKGTSHDKGIKRSDQPQALKEKKKRSRGKGKKSAGSAGKKGESCEDRILKSREKVGHKGLFSVHSRRELRGRRQRASADNFANLGAGN